LDWSVSQVLLTGTLTLLLADIDGSTRLWQTQPAQMAAAIAQLDRTLADVVAAHHGVRSVERAGSDGFMVAFGRAADAVACALRLQLAPLGPIKLRIGMHTGDVQVRDDDYVGSTVDRTERLRDLAHGGQTLLSATTTDMVLDQLPAQAWLIDCGVHQLRELPRVERVSQLCHPETRNQFPPLRAPKNSAAVDLPAQLTNFIGRGDEIAQVKRILAENRLVTLIGAGGAGKSRLAIEVAAQLASGFADGLGYIDLEPLTDTEIAPIVMARALRLPEQPGDSALDTLRAYLIEREVLLVLDNCEHLLDEGVAQLNDLLRACPRVTALATSREPMKVTGEVIWRVPSLSSADEIAFFADRARLAQPDFVIDDDNTALVHEICQRLEGIPLGIELAAARVRSLSLDEILDGLDDTIRLLTGGARTALQRHQTLRASLDWSYGLLSEPERILFCRLGIFVGGFDLEAVREVAGYGDLPRYQVLDVLTLLVDKSLVVADSSHGRTRYRRLDGVGQYATEKLNESDEADTMRARYRDYYTALVAPLDTPERTNYPQLLDRAETEIGNLRAAFGYCRESSDFESALTLTSSLQPLWLNRGRIREGRTWFESVLAEENTHDVEVAAAVRARALADKAILDMFIDAGPSLAQAQQALAIAREVDDPALLARALTAFGLTAGFNYRTEVVQQYFAEAAEYARGLDDRWRLSQILSSQSNAAVMAGDANTAHATGREGLELADAIGDRISSRQCRMSLAYAQLWQGGLAAAVDQFGTLVAEPGRIDADIVTALSLKGLGDALAYQGDVSGAREAGEAAIEGAGEIGEYFVGLGYATLAIAALADGDVGTAREVSEMAWQKLSVQPHAANYWRGFKALVLLADGDLAAAREYADEAVSSTSGWHRSLALTTRARTAIAQGESGQAERDAHDALSCAAEVGAYNCLPAIFECLAQLAVEEANHREAARLFGAADAHRQRTGRVRLKIYDARYQASVGALRASMGAEATASAWADGAALSTEESIAYAQRSRGEQKRATSGWGSLTRAELDVVRLVGEGLSNKEIAGRLFISPRTAQTHLTHVYTKLGFSSRVQLAQEATRHL
jgi:predicted ATPase/class 3 adenylate cyclase/DNA-binding CsgD family transcriptional regulator